MEHVNRRCRARPQTPAHCEGTYGAGRRTPTPAYRAGTGGAGRVIDSHTRRGNLLPSRPEGADSCALRGNRRWPGFCYGLSVDSVSIPAGRLGPVLRYKPAPAGG